MFSIYYDVYSFLLLSILGIKYDVIIFDVDNKDPQVGITCPPVDFLQINVLNEVVRCLTDKGMKI